MRRTLALLISLTLLLSVGATAVAAPAVPVFSSAKIKTKAVALTFDDGWSAATSERVRQILKTNNIRATIFPAAAWAKQNPELMAGFLADGHEFGNHSLTHPDLTKLSRARQLTEITGAGGILQSIASSQYTSWFRPPYGAYNATTLQLAAELGLRVVLWSVDSWDWREIPSTQVVQRVLGSVRPGSVILMHLAGRNTVAALPEIISGLRGAGYQFVTLSDLAALDSSTTVPPLPDHSVQIIQNGQALTLNPEAVLLAGKAYVPCRAFLEMSGFRTSWDETSQTASFKSETGSLVITAGSADAKFNGIWKHLSTQAVTIDGRLYAPVRPIAELLGFEVLWDNAMRSVVLK